jgi:hypothetical protein
MLRVVCFKWKHQQGHRLQSLSVIGEYTADHVNAMGRALEKYLTIPYEFICITDDPTGINYRTIPLWDKCRDLGGCYNRLYVFSEDMRDLIGDRFVCIDLDCVIVGNLDELFSREEDFIINHFYGKNPHQFYNGGLFMMNAGARKQVWEEFQKDPEGNRDLMVARNKQRELLGTDQAWISHVLGRGEVTFTDDQDGVEVFHLLPNARSPKRGKDILPRSKLVLMAGKIDPTTEYRENIWIQEYWDGYIDPIHAQRPSPEKMAQRIEAVQKETISGSQKLGYTIDIMNPESMSEKLIYRKHFCRDPLLVITADKIRVKDYIREKLGDDLADRVLIPNLYITKDPETIPFAQLPDDYIVKPNHMSGPYRIIRRGESPMVTKRDVIRECTRWLRSDYGQDKNEWHYSEIERQILIEPLLLDQDGNLPLDYKIHVMNGKIAYIYVTNNRFEETPIFGSYTDRWERLPFRTRKGWCSQNIPRPKRLKTMIDIAKKLAEPFPYVRVDLYVVGDLIFCGELTHFSESGYMRITPISADFKLGKQLKL